VTYLGNPPVNGVFKKLDNISGSFNGSTTTFNLTSGGAATTPGLAQNLIISLGGVIQEPGSAFTINGSTVSFTSAPATNTTFWGIQLGDVGLATNPNQSAMTTQVFTATAGQTTFTVAGGYTAGQIQIFENGVQLVIGADVTASNGTTFVLTNAATVGDTLVAIVYSSFIVANAVAKSGDTMTGDLTVQTSAYLATVSGNVGVGTSSPTSIANYKSVTVSSAAGGGWVEVTNGTVRGVLQNGVGDATLETRSNHPLIFGTNATERARINSSGIITAPYQTAFNAYGGGTQSFGGAQSTVVVQFNAQDFLGVRSTGYNTSTYRFTAPVSGAYLLCGRIVNTTSGSTGPEFTFRVNGVSTFYCAINYANNSYVTTSGQVVVYLNASDYVETCITNNNSTSFTLDLTRSNFCGFLIG